MGRNTSFTLSDHLASFVEDKVAEGRYASASEVVRAGLRLLEEQEAKLAALRGALVEGEASGAAEPFDFEALIAGGVRAIEITMTTPNALAAIREAREKIGECALIGVGTVLDAEMTRMRREITILRQERDILKKAAEFWVKECS